MAEKFIVLHSSVFGTVYDSEEEANDVAGDLATPSVVVTVSVPDEGQHAVYSDIHEWAQETDDPQNKNRKYADRYHGNGRDFDEHRSIPVEVVNAYYDQKGKNAEDKTNDSGTSSKRRVVKVQRDT